MAIMIPSLETRDDFNGSMGEMHLSELLRQLPDDYYIFHSVKWNKRRPSDYNPKYSYVDRREADFLIYYPSRGIISLEVKDGEISYNPYDGWQQRNRKTGQISQIDPMFQAEHSMYFFKEVLENRHLSACCKICAAVWFTSADRAAMQGEYPHNYHKETVLWSNDMTNPIQAQQALNAVFDFHDFPRREIDPENISAVVSAIAPNFNAFESVQSVRDASKTLFYLMTREQSNLLDYLEEQDVAAIHGCAGTGKTMLAIQKAQRLCEDAPVLFLCFNSFLKEYLKDCYARENLTITNLDALYTHNTGRLLPSGTEGAAQKKQEMEEFLCSWQDYGLPYKHIVIDEGQDFADEHLGLLHAIAMENKGCFYVFYDRHQFVQGDRMPAWLDDMECRLVLSRNCRNTFGIALTSTRPVGIAEEKVKMKLDVIEDNSGLTKPRMYILRSHDELLATLEARLSSFVQDGVPRDQIVVLTMKTMETSLIGEEDYNLSQKIRLASERTDGKILFTTVRKFKGLEADVVICVDVDADSFESERKRNAFYVGTSRAKLFLELLAVLPQDGDLIALANSLGTATSRNSTRARAAIASGLKIKYETDIRRKR